MDIKAAAEFLGISIKSIERAVRKKQIAVTYINGKRYFSEDELITIKEQKQQPTYRPALVATRDDTALSQAVAPEYLGEGLGYLEAIAKSAEGIASVAPQVGSYYQLATIQAKKTMSLREAAIISGVSVNFLKYHLKSGSLSGQKLGRGWRIRPQDLDEFVDKLFMAH